MCVGGPGVVRRLLAAAASHCVGRDAIHAYVFMTNHVHLLMTPAADAAIGKAMQSIGRRYVHHFNTRYVRTGTLWEGRYKATVVDSEAYLITCYRYIELNPVRAGMVHDPRDYPWSSHRANALGGSDPLVTPHDVYLALGSKATPREAAYRALFGAELAPRRLPRFGTRRTTGGRSEGTSSATRSRPASIGARGG